MIHQLLLCRAFILLPLFGIMFIISIILIFRCVKKKLSISKKILYLSFIFCTIVITYFMFGYGNFKTVDLNKLNCQTIFDSILQSSKLEKQSERYWGSEDSQYYYMKHESENCSADIHVIYGDLQVEQSQILNNGLSKLESTFADIHSKEIIENSITCYISALRAHKEEWYGVKVFNGNYSGTLLLTQNNVNIVIDYTIMKNIGIKNAFITG